VPERRQCGIRGEIAPDPLLVGAQSQAPRGLAEPVAERAREHLGYADHGSDGRASGGDAGDQQIDGEREVALDLGTLPPAETGLRPRDPAMSRRTGHKAGDHACEAAD